MAAPRMRKPHLSNQHHGQHQQHCIVRQLPWSRDTLYAPSMMQGASQKVSAVKMCAAISAHPTVARVPVVMPGDFAGTGRSGSGEQQGQQQGLRPQRLQGQQASEHSPADTQRQASSSPRSAQAAPSLLNAPPTLEGGSKRSQESGVGSSSGVSGSALQRASELQPFCCSCLPCCLQQHSLARQQLWQLLPLRAWKAVGRPACACNPRQTSQWLTCRHLLGSICS